MPQTLSNSDAVSYLEPGPLSEKAIIVVIMKPDSRSQNPIFATNLC